MPYISAQKVREIRNSLKSEFPDFKFSVKNSNGMKVCISILTAPFELRNDTSNRCEDVNVYYYQNQYLGMSALVFRDILAIATNGMSAPIYDSDYGDIPEYYVSLTIGSYEKDFKVIDKKAKYNKE